MPSPLPPPDIAQATAQATALSALSPVDGRYADQTRPLARHFSESALIEQRIHIELAWLRTLLPHTAPAHDTHTTHEILDKIAQTAATAAPRVKALESQTRHDVKAVEYWLAEQLTHHALPLHHWIHFGCTSWDINNIAQARQITAALRQTMHPAALAVQSLLRQLATDHADAAMLARTHGQPASPTTVGKEFANYVTRLAPRLPRLAALRLPAKFSGAVGNFNAHTAARPDLDWPHIARQFVESMDCTYATHTTQIEPYDDLADLFDHLRRLNTILLDLCRDCWGYIALDYFTQPPSPNPMEAGSSTMPHKINPIDFENAEGNIGIANALFAHFADKLPVSRWQRDLSDSTVLRAIGTAFGHTLIAWRATAAGLQKLHINRPRLQSDLDSHWEILTEAIQTVMRAHGAADAYDTLKTFSRGKPITRATLHAFLKNTPLALPPEARTTLLNLTPPTYTGLASTLATQLPPEESS